MPLTSSIQTSSDLLSQAVHRSSKFSAEGLLERAFTKVFSGLVYPQIWEDPAVDMATMELTPQQHIVTIASGGCNVLSYLSANPNRISAVDLNHTHVALTRLKLAGLTHLPGWQEFYAFFGEASSAANVRIYDHYIKPKLDESSRNYWEGRPALGRRRISRFARNFYRSGLLGTFIGAAHAFAALYGRNPAALLDCATMQEQEAAFEKELAPLFDKRLVRWVTGRKSSLYGLGIPPAQYDALAGERDMADVLRERLRRLACGFPIQSNYFAWQAFSRGYAPDAVGPLPPYLDRANFETLRRNASRVTVQQASITDLLKQSPPGSVDRVVLLDAQDWMTDRQLNELWSAITGASARAARVLFRTAGEESILPGRVHSGILSRWKYLEQLSRKAGAQDRSSIYGGFHVYERND